MNQLTHGVGECTDELHRLFYVDAPVALYSRVLPMGNVIVEGNSVLMEALLWNVKQEVVLYLKNRMPQADLRRRCEKEGPYLGFTAYFLALGPNRYPASFAWEFFHDDEKANIDHFMEASSDAIAARAAQAAAAIGGGEDEGGEDDDGDAVMEPEEDDEEVVAPMEAETENNVARRVREENNDSNGNKRVRR